MICLHRVQRLYVYHLLTFFFLACFGACSDGGHSAAVAMQNSALTGGDGGAAAGNQWTVENSGSSSNLVSVSGYGQDVWAVGEAGTVLHRGGGVWQSEDGHTNDDIESVWASSSDDVWAVTSQYQILHRINGEWTSDRDADSQTPLVAIGGNGTDVWAVGRRLLHRVGGSWVSEEWEPNSSTEDFFFLSVWGDGANVWVFGNGPSPARNVVLRRTAGTWFAEPTQAWTGGAVWSNGTDAWTLGQASSVSVVGDIQRRIGTTWSADYSIGKVLKGIWGNDTASHVWAVGGNFYCDRIIGGFCSGVHYRRELIHRKDGIWSDEASQGDRNDRPTDVLTAIWGNATDAWAVGASGSILHRRVLNNPNSPVGGPCDANSDCTSHVCDETAGVCLCQADTDCPNLNYCDSDHSCKAKLAGGGSCSFADQCIPGYCAAGVCCSSVCNAPCEKCDGTGTCQGCTTDQFCYRGDLCLPRHCDATSLCPAGYFCDIGSNCEPLHANGSVGPAADCASGIAADGVCCDRACTGGCERCDVSGSVGTCTTLTNGEPGRSTCGAGYVCHGGTDCPTTCTNDAQCAAGFYCANGSCTAKIAQGHACVSDSQCGTGFCTDGVCCNSRCDVVADVAGNPMPQGCGSCGLVGAVGVCTAAPLGSCANVPPFAPTPIPPGLSSSFVDVTSFLYKSGTQTMPDGSPLSDGTIRPDRGAVVRGRVLVGTTPLAGAVVSIRNHPQYGRTATRVDGQYDLAVNGGESLVIRVDAPNHPSAFREVYARPRDYKPIDDIVLVPYGGGQTINLTDTTQYHAMQSEVVGNGTAAARSVALLFPAGARVHMQFSTGPIDILEPTLHVTEYTKGDGDRAAMPATLPPTSAYTFAANFLVEPPTGIGEKPSAVTFVDATGNPVMLPAYVDNFLGFPVGTTAPLGDYNETDAYWRANPSGTIVRILHVDNGIASVDDVGDGQPHNDHFAVGELQMLGQLFPTASNREFMRVLLPHFTDYDINQGRKPPDDAVFPPPQGPRLAGASSDGQSCRIGSIIECQAQTLSEVVPLAGTPFHLVYRSDRQLSYSAQRTIRIPVDPATFPASLLGVAATVEVAGRVISTYTPRNNVPSTHEIDITWDGLDAYGRAISGEIQANVRWGFVYSAVYGTTTVFGYNGGGRITTAAGYNIGTRDQLILWGDWYTQWLESYDARSIGLRGWTLDVNHHYDVQRGVLYRGDDRSRHVQSRMPWQIDTIVGGPNNKVASMAGGLSGIAVGLDGAVYFGHSFYGNAPGLWELRDGVAAQVPLTMNGASFLFPDPATFLASDRDGNLVVAVGSTVYRVVLSRAGGRTTGLVSIAANPTNRCYSSGSYGPGDQMGDGLPASDPRVKICGIRAIGTGVDGSTYVAENNSGRIRRIGPDGVISTIYGISSVNPNTNFPGGNPTVTSLVGAPDGSIYIAVNSYWLRRITAEGLLVDVTSRDDNHLSTADGALAATTYLGYVLPNTLLHGRDGSLYFTQNNGNEVRRIRNDGVLETVAGQGNDYGSYQGDGGPAVGFTVRWITGIAEGPLGEILLIDSNLNGNPGVRRVTGPRPRGASTAIYVASDDGSEIYAFDATGQHLQTLDGRTGMPRLAFTYDHGQLASVQQFTSLTGVPMTTTLDGSGNVLVITGPYGHQTHVFQDGHGYGSIIANPANEQTAFAFGNTGWLGSETDPRGNEHVFTADTLGRLTRDADPAGGTQAFALDSQRALVRVTTSGGTPAEHELTTSSGTVTLTDRFQTQDNDLDRLVTTTTIRNTGARTVIETDGRASQTQICNDQRFGSAMQTICDGTVTADGVTSTFSRTSNALCSTTGTCGTGIRCDDSAADVTTLLNETSYLTVNGHNFTDQYVRCPDGVTPAPVQTLTATSTQRQVKVQYDLLGRVTSTGIVDDRPNAVYPTTLGYFDDGRLRTIARGDRIVRFDYNPTTIDGGSGNLRALTVSGRDGDVYTVGFDDYDGAGRLRHALLAGGRPITIGHDSSGNVSGFSPPSQPEHTFAFDALDRLAVYQAPPASEPTMTTLQYDTDRRLSVVAQPGQAAVVAQYDARGRLSSLTHPSTKMTFTYERAKAGDLDASHGRLLSVADQTGATLSYGYAPSGSMPLSQTWSGGPVHGSVAVTYDSDGRLATENVNGGNSITWHYDTDGFLTQAGDMTFTPDSKNGLLTGSVYGNVVDQRTYNRYGELASYRVLSKSKLVYEVIYDDVGSASPNSRDTFGRVRHKTERTIDAATGQLDEAVRDYVYDAVGRLWRVLDQNGNELERYEYDPNGNRTLTSVNGIIVSNVVVDAQDRLTSSGASTFTYTPAGQLRTKTVAGVTTTYEWSPFGDLSSISWLNLRIEYLYDAQHRRIGRRKWLVSAQPPTLLDEKHWLYDSQLRIVAELDGQNQMTSQFIYAEHENVPSYIAQPSRYLRVITDQNGSVRLLLDPALGTVVQRYDYADAFGTPASMADAWGIPFGFAGGLYDPDVGLVHFGARDYDSATGRWLSKDPTLFAGGDFNLYAYVANDPVNHIDPRGLWAGVDDGIFALGGALMGLAGQAIGDAITGHMSGWQDYVGSAVGGATSGMVLLYAGPVAAGAAGGATGNIVKQLLHGATDPKTCGFKWFSFGFDTTVGALTGFIPGIRASGLNAGRNSLNAIFKQMVNKFENDLINNVSPGTALKMLLGRAWDTAMVQGTVAGGVASGLSGRFGL